MGKFHKHLSLAERSMIEAQLKLGLRPGAIAAPAVDEHQWLKETFRIRSLDTG